MSENASTDTPIINTAISEDEKYQIVRYKNRKFYDTVKSKYVNLGDVLDVYRSGVKLEVYDKREKVDKVTTEEVLIEGWYRREVLENKKYRELILSLLKNPSDQVDFQ